MKCIICGKEFITHTKRKTCCSRCAWILGKRTKRKNRKLKKRVRCYKGTYKGIFTIKFGDDLKNDNYDYPQGVLTMPIREELEIIVR